ncbi:MAG TPA: tetratricopeptide repeat protein [Pyrinomonadaceae bacterium]|nr:tetratricopeptide repeat protein [Pyrinomonadaceae bacterium]
MSREQKELYEFGDFRLDVGERQLERLDGTTKGSLPEKAFQTLVHLVRNPGELLTKEELLSVVWPDTIVEENNLGKAIHALRQYLGEKTGQQKYIETVPKHGYRFVAHVRRAESIGRPPAAENGSVAKIDDTPRNTERRASGLPDSSGDETPTQSDEKPQTSFLLPVTSSRPNLLFRRWPLVLIGLLLLSGLLLGLNAGGLRERLLGTGTPVRIQSLAVLPLENLSGDASQEYFADGMTDAVITDLAKIGALRVIARPSVMQYKGAQRPLSEIGRELNVDAVLTGSVLRSGERVRIAVQLTHIATDRNLWADSYERDLRDVLALQKDVTRDIVGQIRIKLTPQEQGQFGSVRPVNPEAYDHYLRGKFYLHRQDKDNNEAAITALEYAVGADPTFAAAHAELAQAYVWKLFLFSPEEKDLTEKAFVSAEKALSLDPELAVAYLARGRLLWTPANRFPHDKAIIEYRRAIELDPNLDEARNQLALVYNHIGAFDEALRELKLAIETNPGNSLARFRIGETLLFQGRYEQALAALRDTPKDANPALVGHQIVWALFNLGRKKEAAAALDQFLKENPADNRGLFTSQLAVMAASEGRSDEAEAKIRQAIENGKGFGHFHHTAFHIASAYALMNKRQEATNWLESAAENGFPCYVMFENESSLANLRGDPRFKALMEKLEQRWGVYQNSSPQ